MKDNEIIRALAEMEGWTSIELLGNKFVGIVPDAEMMDSQDADIKLFLLPDYLEDRNPIISLIRKQKFNTQISIVHHIFGQVAIQHSDEWRTEDIVAILLATPKELCIALLKATNKWKE